jgi:hypothetical protein
MKKKAMEYLLSFKNKFGRFLAWRNFGQSGRTEPGKVQIVNEKWTADSTRAGNEIKLLLFSSEES